MQIVAEASQGGLVLYVRHPINADFYYFMFLEGKQNKRSGLTMTSTLNSVAFFSPLFNDVLLYLFCFTELHNNQEDGSAFIDWKLP